MPEPAPASASASVKVALITGAARRIGAAIARRLHADGYAIALHFNQSQRDAHALAADLDRARSGSVLLLQGDLADFDRLPELIANTVGHFGRLDALVNNASAFFPTPLGATTPDQWEALFAANVRAPFFLSQAAAPHLRATCGAIVNLTDIYAQQPREDLMVYATSKGALESLTRGLAVALAPDVRVNAVAPGAVIWPDSHQDPVLRERLLDRTLARRQGTPEEVASAVAWLLDGATYTTGEVIRVDGGRVLS